MVCKGICVRHRAQKPLGAFGRYATGQKRCQVCEIFLKWDGMWCPCCGYRVRTRPRGHKFKERLRIMNQNMKSNSSVNSPVQRPKEDFILVVPALDWKSVRYVLTEPYSSLWPCIMIKTVFEAMLYVAGHPLLFFNFLLLYNAGMMNKIFLKDQMLIL